MMDEATTIARGGEPAWEQSFKHDAYPEPLTFRARRLPTGRDWLAVAALQEELAPGVTQGSGAMLAEAMAGISTLMDLPVLREDREEDPDNPSHVKIHRVFYDPTEDERWEFPVVVWSAFLTWRVKVLSTDTVEQVKNSFGATSEKPNGDSSPVTGDSPPSTLS